MRADTFDVVVIGGGISGAHAALPLVDAGARVCMLDGGIRAGAEIKEREGDFEDIRRSDSSQHELFLGEELSGIVSSSHGASMTSGARAYVSHKTDEHLPLTSNGAQLIQSLAKGGLSEVWGAVSSIFSDEELSALGFPAEEMHEAYREIIERLGFSGDAEGYSTQKPLAPDLHAKNMLHKYAQLPKAERARFEVRQPLLAALSEQKGGRGALTYRDIEYASNDRNAIYRARFTIEELEQKKNFSYTPERVVERTEPEHDSYKVIACDFSGALHEYRARKVVVAAGALNSTRILARSFGITASLPFMAKENTLIACLDRSSIGKKPERRRHSLCQLVLEDSQKISGTPRSFSHLYSYGSLLLFRLAQYAPLPAPEALSLFSLWAPLLVVADVRTPVLSPNLSITLKEDGVLDVHTVPTSANKAELKRVKTFLRSLGVWPLKSSKPPLGASVHYAGGVPMRSGAQDSSLMVDESCRLTRSPGIFIADSATWRMLPAKPSGLTMMANARRVGKIVTQELGLG